MAEVCYCCLPAGFPVHHLIICPLAGSTASPPEAHIDEINASIPTPLLVLTPPASQSEADGGAHRANPARQPSPSVLPNILESAPEAGFDDTESSSASSSPTSPSSLEDHSFGGTHTNTRDFEGANIKDSNINSHSFNNNVDSFNSNSIRTSRW
jgi:hypothetical protein